MPSEGDIREQDGRSEVYHGGRWLLMVEKKPTRDKSNDKPAKVVIDGKPYHATAIPKTFKSGKEGFTIVLNLGQGLRGTGNFFNA